MSSEQKFSLLFSCLAASTARLYCFIAITMYVCTTATTPRVSLLLPSHPIQPRPRTPSCKPATNLPPRQNIHKSDPRHDCPLNPLDLRRTLHRHPARLPASLSSAPSSLKSANPLLSLRDEAFCGGDIAAVPSRQRRCNYLTRRKIIFRILRCEIHGSVSRERVEEVLYDVKGEAKEGGGVIVLVTDSGNQRHDV